MNPETKLVLASASPRRRELLAERGYRFTIDAADIDEQDYAPDLSPAEIAEVLARRKAEAVAARHPQSVTLAADTVVAAADGFPVGKPVDAEDARKILRRLSGTRHEVITAVCVAAPVQRLIDVRTVRTSVAMRALSNAELEAYIASGLWEGKAGAYGIQDNDPFVTRIDGSLTNVVGLPMEETAEMLKRVGVLPGDAPVA